MNDLVVGEDGRARCGWGASTPDYLRYHDEEWGKPVHDADALFERLCLEAFQSGLSWLTILRKREAFRAAFADFDARRVAAFGPRDIALAEVRDGLDLEAREGGPEVVALAEDREPRQP